MKHPFLLLLFLFTSCAHIKKLELPSELNEASGLVYYKNMLISINDSDNPPLVYFISDKGELKHQVYIQNAINWDWEALAIEGNYLYIGDFGNNLNNREDLRIFQVALDDILEKDTVEAKTIHFSYSEQTEFPPTKANLYYDAEAMIIQNERIYIFTKNRTEPFDGISKVYSFPLKEGEHVAQFEYNLHLPSTNWHEESITDAFLHDENLYLLTYSKIYILYQSADNKWVIQSSVQHKEFTQKEGIAVTEKGVYVVDEVSSSPFDPNPEDRNFLYRYRKSLFKQ